MTRWFAKLTLALPLATAIVLQASPARAISIEQIMTLCQVGVPGDEMIKAIERDKTVFNLTVGQILELKKAGVPDAVLKYMLKTPQLFGKEPAPGEKKPDEKKTITIEEMTPEERAALEAKQRAEAEKLAVEAKRAEESQRRAFAQGILKNGMDLANAGRCTDAINTFLDFIQKGGFQKGSEEHYNAWFGIANALASCGWHQSAAKYFVDVLLEGPEKQFFQQAFWKLREVRKKVNYAPPDLEELTKFSTANFSKRFQDEYNYFLGEFFFDYNNFNRALAFFDQVSAEAPDYGKAVYLTGLVQVQNNLYKSAVENFQKAIIATENNKSDAEVSDLSYLALARIAHEAENFDASIYYYRRVSQDSNKLPVAFYESAWTFFKKADYTRALGTFQALHSPFFKHYFYPELWILEATAYVNMCRADYAREALKQFTDQVESLGVPLKQLLGQLKTPQDYFNALIGIAEKKPPYQIDKRVIQPILANVEFFNLYKTVRHIEWEEGELKKNEGKLGQFGTDLSIKLAQLRQSRVNEAGIKVQQILKQLEAEMADYSVKKTEIEIDLTVIENETIESDLQGKPVEDGKPGAAKEGSTAIVGTDAMSWPFEGEFWKDGIGGFRSFLKSQCKQ